MKQINDANTLKKFDVFFQLKLLLIFFNFANLILAINFF